MTPPSFYILNFYRIARELMAEPFRYFELWDLFRCFLAPVETLYQDFLTWRADCLYRLGHNSQVCYLQAALNDRFDNTERRIYITNVEVQEPVWIYEPEDDKPVRFYEPEDEMPVYFREDFEFEGGAYDFTVMVPIELHPATSEELQAYLVQMRALVDYYKLFCKEYNIIFY